MVGTSASKRRITLYVTCLLAQQSEKCAMQQQDITALSETSIGTVLLGISDENGGTGALPGSGLEHMVD